MDLSYKTVVSRLTLGILISCSVAGCSRMGDSLTSQINVIHDANPEQAADMLTSEWSSDNIYGDMSGIVDDSAIIDPAAMYAEVVQGVSNTIAVPLKPGIYQYESTPLAGEVRDERVADINRVVKIGVNGRLDLYESYVDKQGTIEFKYLSARYQPAGFTLKLSGITGHPELRPREDTLIINRAAVSVGKRTFPFDRKEYESTGNEITSFELITNELHINKYEKFASDDYSVLNALDYDQLSTFKSDIELNSALVASKGLTAVRK